MSESVKIDKPAPSALKFLQRELNEHIKRVIEVENALIKAGFCGERHHFHNSPNGYRDWEWNPARTGIYIPLRESFSRVIERAHDYWGKLEIQQAEEILAGDRGWHRETQTRHSFPTHKQVREFRRGLEEKKAAQKNNNDQLE